MLLIPLLALDLVSSTAPTITAASLVPTVIAAPLPVVSPGDGQGGAAGLPANSLSGTVSSVSPPATPTLSNVVSSQPSSSGNDLAVEAPHDPWEKTNRHVFAFDRSADHLVLAPISHGYHHIVPVVVRHHLTLILANMNEPITTANDLLQLHVGRAGKSMARFVMNSTFGLAGLFDIAKDNGLPARPADFGQTLGRWGVGAGPYVMLPFLGPSNVRDSFGRLTDAFIDPVGWLIGGFTTTPELARDGTSAVDTRSRADSELNFVYAATDPYATARSAYMQERAAAVSDATGAVEALPDFSVDDRSQNAPFSIVLPTSSSTGG